MEIPYTIDLQNACESTIPVPDSSLFDWISLALKPYKKEGEITLRLVDPPEMTALNHSYRKQNKPTNVLAFPPDIPDYIDLEAPWLGDIIICPKVLEEESLQLAIPLEAHWAHILIHGVLHLLGFDHQEEADTREMQTLEIAMLAQCGFDNPYDEVKD